MTRRTPEMLLWLMGIIITILFTAGLLWLFALRFQHGDIYPPYSSLRSDPLGTKALYDSLDDCAGITVSRNYQPLNQASFPSDATLLFLGDTMSKNEFLPVSTIVLIESMVKRGARIVITLQPYNVEPKDEEDDEEEQEEDDEEEQEAKNPDVDTTEDIDEEVKPSEEEDSDTTEDDPEEDEPSKRQKPKKYITIERWLGITVDDLPLLGRTQADLNLDAGLTNLPPSISCNTSIFFTNASFAVSETNKTERILAALSGQSIPTFQDVDLVAAQTNKHWTTIYSRDDKPVIMETQIGKGSMVLSSLSYFTSNEALKDTPHPTLILWLIGNSDNVIFDETHLRVGSSPNVATLARRYNLEWLIGSLIILALFFIWRNSSSLGPPHKSRLSQISTHLTEGKGADAGLVNLLRRNIPNQSILKACIEEWRKTSKTPDQIEDTLTQQNDRPRETRDAALEYNELCDALKKRHHSLRNAEDSSTDTTNNR